jgi:hypothetical protein
MTETGIKIVVGAVAGAILVGGGLYVANTLKKGSDDVGLSGGKNESSLCDINLVSKIVVTKKTLQQDDESLGQSLYPRLDTLIKTAPKGQDSINNYEFGYNGGRLTSFLLNGFNVELEKSEELSEKQLVESLVPTTGGKLNPGEKALVDLAVVGERTEAENGHYCGLIILGPMGALFDQRLNDDEFQQRVAGLNYLNPGANIEGKWFKEKSLIGRDVQWSRYNYIKEGNTAYVETETRDFGDTDLDEAFGDKGKVTIDYAKIDLNTGFVQKRVNITYVDPSVTSIDQVDTGKSISSWMAGHANAEYYSELEVKVYSTGGDLVGMTTTVPMEDPKAPPSNLKVSISSQTGEISLTWKNNSSRMAKIVIERATDKNGSEFKELEILEGDPQTYSYALEDVALEGDSQVYRVKAIFDDESVSGYSNIAVLSNCVPLGEGRGVHTIVFRRTDSPTKPPIFLKNIYTVFNNSIGTYEPFKSYASWFKFYVDLKQVPSEHLGVNQEADDSYIENTSSCGTGARYVQIISDRKAYYALTSLSKKVITMNISPTHRTRNGEVRNIDTTRFFSQTLIHEFGHVFGGLVDEYSEGGSDWLGFILSFDITDSDPNCVFSPKKDYRGSDNRMYGALPTTSTAGCGGVEPKAGLGLTFYRPSPSSIMKNNLLDGQKFNVVSCGYIISGIVGEPTDKAHAQKYWPKCMTLDTEKTGIPSVNPAPKINIPPQGFLITPGFNLKITGSGFTTSGNAVNLSRMSVPTSQLYLVSTAYADTATTTIEILDIPSADGKSITFTMPTSTPLGLYELRVGAFNSDWSSSVPLMVQ